jgi:hypothetical protein
MSVKFIPDVRSSQAAKTSNLLSERAHTACSKIKIAMVTIRVYAFPISHSYFSHISQTYLRQLGNLRDFLNFPFKFHQKRPITVNLNGKFNISRKFAARTSAGLRDINEIYETHTLYYYTAVTIASGNNDN